MISGIKTGLLFTGNGVMSIPGYFTDGNFLLMMLHALSMALWGPAMKVWRNLLHYMDHTWDPNDVILKSI